MSALKEAIEKALTDKDEHVLVRFGGLIAKGLMELGGRNCNIKLVSNSGNNKLGSIVGMTLFTQYYYWFPLVHFINLAVHPTMLLGIDSNLRIVKNFNVLSKAKPSVYGYPKEVKVEEKAKVEKAPTAVLSTQSRVKAKLGRRTGTLTSIADMQVDETNKQNTSNTNVTNNNKPLEKIEEKESEKVEEKPATEPEEPSEEVLTNPCRILPKQILVVENLTNQDYEPIIKNRFNGILLLKKVNLNAEPDYFDVDIQNTQNLHSANNTNQQNNSYQTLQTQDVEMPEEIDLTNIK